MSIHPENHVGEKDWPQSGTDEPTTSANVDRQTSVNWKLAASDLNSDRDWRIWLGLVLTFSYLMIMGFYVARVIGWQHFFDEPIQQVGSFLEGAFAPLAFLWLVIGYFLQKKELMLNTQAISKQNEVIRLTADHAAIQSDAIAATELHARKESFLKIAESVKQQLGATMGFLYISSQGASGSGVVPNEKISELWAAMNEKDPDVFSRQMLSLQATNGPRYSYKLFFGTAIRKNHTDNFIFNFERLLRAAIQCDTDGMIHDALMGTGNGFIYSRAIEARNNPPDGFTLGIFDFDPDSIDETDNES